ncbi:CaiB/BaiF CoA transferase family protein [Nisaea nitritireducens]|uniref:CaiB/BaiF CoA transferase family protein n=1 Tax=Nisaea nitritireducens TaxID=568392 RepID=UPI0018691841|nr:CoA transferase [Nisaea nitritireducens]
MSTAGRYPESDYNSDAKLPLDGVRVLDLSRLVAGNMVTHVLADYGAEVIKIERPGFGDDLRNWRTEGVPTHWKVYCRNKKSITLDLRKPEGKALFLKLAETADAIVENFKPGTLEDWGLGPDVLQGLNPKLTLVRVSGWGQTGPWKHKPGFGSLVEAMSGFAALNGFGDRPPVLPPLALADMIAGLYGAFSVMVALRNVEVSGGKGQSIDLSLFEPIHAILGPEAANFALSGKVPERTGSRSNLTAPRNTYRCKDGKYVALSGSIQAMAERLFRTIGRPELIDDPRFKTNSDRVKNNDILDPIIADYMGERTQAECLAIFEEAGVTVGPVADVAQLADDDYMEGRGVIESFPDAEIGALPMHAVIPRMSDTPGGVRSPAPELGQHNDEIWSALGLDAAERVKLTDAGVI